MREGNEVVEGLPGWCPNDYCINWRKEIIRMIQRICR